MAIKQHSPMYPGQLIKRVYLEPFDLNVEEAAYKLQMNPSKFSLLSNCQSDLDSSMAIKLSKTFGRAPESWLLMQEYRNYHRDDYE